MDFKIKSTNILAWEFFEKYWSTGWRDFDLKPVTIPSHRMLFPSFLCVWLADDISCRNFPDGLLWLLPTLPLYVQCVSYFCLMTPRDIDNIGDVINLGVNLLMVPSFPCLPPHCPRDTLVLVRLPMSMPIVPHSPCLRPVTWPLKLNGATLLDMSSNCRTQTSMIHCLIPWSWLCLTVNVLRSWFVSVSNKWDFKIKI